MGSGLSDSGVEWLVATSALKLETCGVTFPDVFTASGLGEPVKGLWELLGPVEAVERVKLGSFRLRASLHIKFVKYRNARTIYEG